ncbi:MAG: flagellar protein FlaG [Candidatus Neomarinimicrobiota bacterium]
MSGALDNTESVRITGSQWSEKDLSPKPAGPSRATEKKAEEAENERIAQTIDIEKVVQNINEFVQNISTDISFSVDPGSDRPIILVKDKTTGKIIRQIPSEEMIRLTKSMKALAGIIFHQEA